MGRANWAWPRSNIIPDKKNAERRSAAVDLGRAPAPAGRHAQFAEPLPLPQTDNLSSGASTGMGRARPSGAGFCRLHWTPAAASHAAPCAKDEDMAQANGAKSGAPHQDDERNDKESKETKRLGAEEEKAGHPEETAQAGAELGAENAAATEEMQAFPSLEADARPNDPALDRKKAEKTERAKTAPEKEGEERKGAPKEKNKAIPWIVAIALLTVVAAMKVALGDWYLQMKNGGGDLTDVSSAADSGKPNGQTAGGQGGGCDIRVGCELPNGALVRIPDNIVNSLTPFRMELRNVPPETAQVYTSFSMVGMDMGFNRYKFRKQNDEGYWLAKNIALPVCIVSRQDYMVDVFFDKKGYRIPLTAN